MKFAFEGSAALSNEDLSRASFNELELLAGRIRSRIIEVVRRNGGHLSSNLGVVELTIALHRAFHFPADKLIFDVSHQCYAHKILSGRGGEIFEKLRQDGGLCGFCSPDEGPWDIFYCGHAGTALSSALGLAVARDRKGEIGHIIALLGDGSLTCGLTLEALQLISETTRRLIVVLNDNGFSIDSIGGAIASHLKNLRSGTVKSGNSIFDHLGIRHIGPVDGHCFRDLELALADAKVAENPVLIHVKTEKGMGDEMAHATPIHFHGIGKNSSPMASPGMECHGYGQVLGEALCHFAETDPSVVAVTAAMRIGTGLAPFAEKFPDRFFDVGIAESHAITFAAAMAKGGLKPVVCVYSTFAQRVVGQFFHDVYLQNLPIVLCLDRCGISCGDGDTHHGLYDIAQFSCFSNIVYAQPASKEEFYCLLREGMKSFRPFILRYGKGEDPWELPLAPASIPLGTAQVLRRGRHISIWALGDSRLRQALALHEILRERQLQVEVVNARFIRPLDICQLKLSAQCALLVTMEDHVHGSGFGAIVKNALADAGKVPGLLSFAWAPPVGFAESDSILLRRHGQGLQDMSRAIEMAYAKYTNGTPLKYFLKKILHF
ncbi:MAG: 1-deoxy-D-xylulose-5-phosphate synthase [Puniceicoccales bacterium]|jgi:1-deoxy-D-xylulose-5-phosphate synthase|nr:1-deoxy-D-xylulose-5-phosphate synthase [Puniceicoccales bacterium]